MPKIISQKIQKNNSVYVNVERSSDENEIVNFESFSFSSHKNSNHSKNCNNNNKDYKREEREIRFWKYDLNDKKSNTERDKFKLEKIKMPEKSKNIVFIIGIFEGHFSGCVEIIKDLVSLGHKVTCYVLDTFAERLERTGAILKIYSIDKSDILLPEQAPKIAVNAYIMQKAYGGILSEAVKEKEKTDILVDFLMEEN